MAMSNVELYEALKGSIREAAARMIAEVVPPSRELATKTDIANVLTELAVLRGEVKSIARLQQWMLGFFVPLWVGTFGTVVAVVLKG